MKPPRQPPPAASTEPSLAHLLAAELERLGLGETPPTPEQWAAFQERLQAAAVQPSLEALSAEAAADFDLSLLETTADAALIFSPDDELILASNAQASALYAIPVDELVGLPLVGLSSNREAAARWIDELRSVGEHNVPGWHRFGAIQLRRDRSPLAVAIQARRVRLQGKSAVLAIIRDVAGPQRMSRPTAAEEGRFARIFASGPIATGVINSDGYILDANDAMLAMLERTADQVIGLHLAELSVFSGASDEPITIFPMPPVRSVPIRLLGERGSERFALASAEWIELDGELNVLIQLVDITEQKRIEAELRASETRVRRMLVEMERQTREAALLDQIRTMMAREVDLAAVIRAVVQGIRDHYGYDLVSLYLLDGEHLVLQHQVGYSFAHVRIPLTRGIIARTVRTGGPVLLPDIQTDPDYLAAIAGVRSEICVPLFAGETTVGALNVETIDETLDTQDLDLFLALGAHISFAIQRARLVTELRLSNERYDALLRSVQEVIFQTDAQGRWVYLNPAWERLSGIPVSSVIGRDWFDTLHPDDRLRLRLLFARQVRRHETYFQFSARFMSALGEARWCEISGRINYSDDGMLMGAAGAASDVTERYEAQLREREQRRLADALVANAAAVASANTAVEVIQSAIEQIRKVIPHFDALRVALVEDGMAQMAAFPALGLADPESGHHPAWEMPAGDLPLIQPADQPSAGLFRAIAPGEIEVPGLEWVRSAIVAPLRSKESLLGYLYLDSQRPDAFTETEAQWVQGFAGQMGTALHNLRLRADLAGYAQKLEMRVAERTDQYRQAKEQVEAILNTSPEAVALVNPDGQIQQVNRTFINAFGEPGRLGAQPQVTSFLEAASVSPFREALGACMQGTPQRLRVAAVRAGGSTFPAEAAIAPLAGAGGGVYAAVCSLHDITEHQLLEDSLRAALDQERRLVDLKSRFGIMVSHEFRTPLATIQTSTDLLVNYGERISKQRHAEALETIARQVRHLTTMLDDILAISRADAVGMEFRATPTDLAELCHSIAEEVRWLDRNHHQLEYSAEGVAPSLMIDRALLQRVLINLLTNAVKYSPDGSLIELRLRQDGDHIVLVVRDRGLGIPEAELPRLFSAFFRASNVGVIPGTGLGLAIAQRAIEAHGGRIEVESQSGVGTAFTIRLPAVPA